MAQIASSQTNRADAFKRPASKDTVMKTSDEFEGAVNVLDTTQQFLIDIAKVTNPTDDERKDLAQAIVENTSPRYEEADVAGAAKELAYAGMNPDEIIQALPVAIEITIPGITDLETAAKVVAITPEIFGITVTQSTARSEATTESDHRTGELKTYSHRGLVSIYGREDRRPDESTFEFDLTPEEAEQTGMELIRAAQEARDNDQ